MKTSQVIGGLFAAATMLYGGTLRASTVVEFSEAGLPTFTLLDGSSAFSGNGLSFDSEETYVVSDRRFLFAGADSWGLTTRTTAADNVFSLNFDQGATSVSFKWVTVWSADFYATAYDADGGSKAFVVKDLNPGLHSGSGTLVADAGQQFVRITFHDGAGFVGVGAIEYTGLGSSGPVTAAVPSPAAAWGGFALLGALSGALGVRRLKRRA